MLGARRAAIALTVLLASCLSWVIYLLLARAKLGSPTECFALAQVCVVLLAAPYLAAYTSRTEGDSVLLTLSRISTRRRLLMQLATSQMPLLCWAFLSTGFLFFSMELPFMKALQMLAVLSIYSFSAGAVGMWGAKVFRDVLFSTEFAYLLWCATIGGMFLLAPLERYIDSVQPIIPLVLHANPLIAVCAILGETDIFRTPLLYELTPIPSYLFAYPPWYLVCFWQVFIGGICLFSLNKFAAAKPLKGTTKTWLT